MAAFAESITVEDLERDPYPIYERLRDEEPVAYVPSVGLWLVTRWDDVQHIATHPELFTAEVDSSPLARTLGVNVLTLDGDAQRRIRATIDPSMRPRAVEATAPDIILPIAERYLAAFEGRGHAELMSEYCEPVSVLALGRVMGLGDLDADTLRRWFGDLAAGGSNFEDDPEKQRLGDAASAEVDEVVGPILDRLESRARRQRAVADAARASHRGGRLTRAEVLANLKLILLGGMQEPGHALGITLWALLSHPDALAAVRDDRALARGAVEEALRWHSPVGTQTRQVTEDAEVGGVTLERGATLAAVLSSANRDDRHWERAGRVRHPPPRRARRRSASARTTAPARRWRGTRCACRCELLLDRLPGLRLDPDHEVELRGWEFRAPTALHVRWD